MKARQPGGKHNTPFRNNAGSTIMSQSGRRRHASASWLQKSKKKGWGVGGAEEGAKMGPNAAINRTTYRAEQQNRKWLSGGRWTCGDNGKAERADVSGASGGLADLRLPLAARPVSAGGAAARGPSDSGGRKVLTSHTDGSTIHNVAHRACAHNTHNTGPPGSGMSPSGNVSQLPQHK